MKKKSGMNSTKVQNPRRNSCAGTGLDADCFRYTCEYKFNRMREINSVVYKMADYRALVSMGTLQLSS